MIAQNIHDCVNAWQPYMNAEDFYKNLPHDKTSQQDLAK